MGPGKRRLEHPGQTDEGLAQHDQSQPDDGGDEKWRETTPHERPGYGEAPERSSRGDVERPPEQDDLDNVISDEDDESGEPVEITPDERGEPDPRRDD